jgi:hypothetical protein
MRTIKALSISFFTVLFIFSFLYLYSKFAPPLPFTVNSVQTVKQNLFQVEGMAKKTAVPDTAFISFGVTKTANTIADAQNQTNMATTKIVDGLKNIGIDPKDIKTTDYSVSPQYNYYANRQTINGYTVTQNMDITIKPVDKVNQATDVATANGANLVGSVNFGFDDATQNQLNNDVRQMAIDDAKEKAQNLAQEAGMHLGRIVDIQENEAPQPPIAMGMAKATLAQPDSAPTNITPGQNTLTATVTLSYETY